MPAEQPGSLAAALIQLQAVRAVLAGFDWEFHDRQLALEEIDRIVNGGGNAS